MYGARLAAFLSLVCTSPAVCQAGRIEPSAPTGGEEIQLLYDADSANAQLTGADEVFATLRISTATGFEDRAVPLRASVEGPLRGSTLIPEDAVSLRIAFSTRRQADVATTLQIPVVDASGRQVRRARIFDAWAHRSRCLETLDEELEQFPDSFSALRTKWFFIRLRQRESFDLDEVRRDRDRVQDLSTPDALVARTYLSILLGDWDAATQAGLLALEKHPESWATVQILKDLRSSDQRIRSATREAATRHPGSRLARNSLMTEWPKLPFDVVDEIVTRWSADEPYNPLPPLYLASSSRLHDTELDKGLEAALRSINGFLSGDCDIAGLEAQGLQDAYLPWGWIVAAKLAHQRGDHASAISYARSCSAHPKTGAAGYEFEAQMWEELQDADQAQNAWLKALQRGSEKATENLRRLRRIAGEEDAAFDDWLNIELAKRREATKREKAPRIHGQDLEGQFLDTALMTGKVVVINFWGLGCAPCKAEIPELNKMVDSFRGKPVEFVALAASPEEDVSDYLAEHPFHYRQLIGGEELRTSMGMRALPAHVVIDGRGRVVAKFTGATLGEPKRLRALIDLALAELD